MALSTTWCQALSATLVVVVIGATVPVQNCPRSLPSEPMYNSGTPSVDVEASALSWYPTSGLTVPVAPALNQSSTAPSRDFLTVPLGRPTEPAPARVTALLVDPA